MNKVEEEETPISRPTKSVTFRSRIKIREHLHIKNYTPTEMKACWYSKFDLTEMKADIYATRNLIVAGKLEQDTEEHVRRGSENYLKKEMTRRSRVKLIARDAVFDEQDAQWEASSGTTPTITEPEYIAHFYKAATHLEVKRAYSVGLRDQMEAALAMT